MTTITIHGLCYRVPDSWDIFTLADYTVTRMTTTQFAVQAGGRVFQVIRRIQ